jgi:hypothetical protein
MIYSKLLSSSVRLNLAANIEGPSDARLSSSVYQNPCNDMPGKKMNTSGPVQAKDSPSVNLPISVIELYQGDSNSREEDMIFDS